MQGIENQSVWRWTFAVIVGVVCSIQGLAVSSDWTTNQVYSPSGSNDYSFLRSVAYGDGKFIAVGERGDGGLLFSSNDGINWTKDLDGGPSGPPGWFGAVAYGDGVFAATGDAFGPPVCKFNGGPWIDSWPNSQATYNFCITCGAGRVMIASGNKISYTTSGVYWTNVVPPFLTNQFSLSGICFGLGKFVAISAEDNAAHWSTTGRTWNRNPFPIPAPANGYWLISFNHGLFTVPYAAGTNLLSADGTNWAVVATQISKKFYGVTFVNGLFAADAEGTLAFSKDGTNYVQSDFPPLPFYSYPSSYQPSGLTSDGFRVIGVAGRNFYAHDGPAGFLEISVAGQLVLYGAIGGSYRIEYADSIGNSGAFLWHSLTNFTLPSSPYSLIDSAGNNAGGRFYRAVLQH
jgi:hypothetical protein